MRRVLRRASGGRASEAGQPGGATAGEMGTWIITALTARDQPAGGGRLAPGATRDRSGAAEPVKA